MTHQVFLLLFFLTFSLALLCSLLRPWSEVKSRRGAPKRIPTDGFACPNQQCLYFGVTDAHIHALVGDGKHGRAERIQPFRCQACHRRSVPDATPRCTG